MDPADKKNSDDTNESESNAAVRTPSNNYESRANARNASSSNRTETRRSTVKDLIERYFYQLIRGCGSPICTNNNCVSSGIIAPMPPNEAAAEALKLFFQDAHLCYGGSGSQTKPQSTSSSGSRANATDPQQTANSTRTSNITSASTSSSSSRRASNTSPMTSTGTNSTSTTSTNSSTSARPNEFYLELAFDLDQPPSPNEQRQLSRRLYGSGAAESSTFGGGLPLLGFLQNSSAAKVLASDSQLNSFLPSTSASNRGRTDLAESSAIDDRSPIEPFSSQDRALLANSLNETLIDELIERGRADGEYELLVRALNTVIPSIDKLSRSFRRWSDSLLNGAASNATGTKMQELLGKSACDMKKEDLRSMEGENEKDEDSTQCNQLQDISNNQGLTTAPMDIEQTTLNTQSPSHDLSMSDYSDNDVTVTPTDFADLKGTNATLVDLESLRRVKSKLSALNEPIIGETLNSNIILLAETIKFHYILWDWEQMLHCLIICFELITDTANNVIDFELTEYSLPKLCQAIRIMPIEAQARLTRVWSAHSQDHLHLLVHCCQQLISLNAIVDEAEVQENSDVIAATMVLRIAYYASILAGKNDPPRNPLLNDVKETESNNTSASLQAMQQDEESELFSLNFDVDSPKTQYPRFADDNLAKELNLRAIYCRMPIVPFDEFYNEPLSENIQMDRDYLCYKKLLLDSRNEESNFSFMLYSFILTPATKVVGLYYDSRIRMYSERHTSMYSIFGFLPGGNSELNSNPELKLKIRRENIVSDALVGLELLALSNPKNLKKQLVIEFVGEQGIDEGGVSKEFFQLIVEEIFNVDFGMFVEMEETQSFWFNSSSFENDAQFTLIGIIIGLAIYNSIILAVRFPMVVYRKLMGAEGAFEDLKDFSPTLYRSLQSMLDYMDDDMEEVFMQTFKINYKNVFGEVIEHELKPGGADILVNQRNKQDFVDLYADFLLNRNVHRQFLAFKKGFEMVTDETPLRLLFRPEEIELLVCGSKKFDFVELEKSTEYEGGYSKDTPVIKYFWEIVHQMPDDSKRKLLEFTTGSDRVPVGGLSRLKLLITRQGPDCERLPTAHTCFNILLLPEYSSKEKLEERLLKAINNSKGFGML